MPSEHDRFGPPARPLVPGHMGQPSDRVIKAARTVFGALLILEDSGIDILRQVVLDRDPRNALSSVPVEARVEAESWLAQWAASKGTG